MYEQFDMITATFQPLRTDDLRESAAEVIGRRLTLHAIWIIEDGPYEGQWAFGVSNNFELWQHVGWIPECDLADVRLLKKKEKSNEIY